MKKPLLAVSLAATFPAVVHAQSAVTLYGIIDEGVSYTSNAATANKAAAASASAASSDAKQALSIAESNTAAIEALNAKIDQMFKRRPGS